MTKVAEYLFADETDADTNAMVARAAAAQRVLAERAGDMPRGEAARHYRCVDHAELLLERALWNLSLKIARHDYEREDLREKTAKFTPLMPTSAPRNFSRRWPRAMVPSTSGRAERLSAKKSFFA